MLAASGRRCAVVAYWAAAWQEYLGSAAAAAAAAGRIALGLLLLVGVCRARMSRYSPLQSDI